MVSDDVKPIRSAVVLKDAIRAVRKALDAEDARTPEHRMIVSLFDGLAATARASLADREDAERWRFVASQGHIEVNEDGGAVLALWLDYQEEWREADHPLRDLAALLDDGRLGNPASLARAVDVTREEERTQRSGHPSPEERL